MSDLPVTTDPGETPGGTADAGMAADLTAAPEAAAADVPPELLAQSLGQYLRAWWLRVRSGNSGVLPVVLAIVVVAVSFQVANSQVPVGAEPGQPVRAEHRLHGAGDG